MKRLAATHQELATVAITTTAIYFLQDGCLYHRGYAPGEVWQPERLLALATDHDQLYLLYDDGIQQTKFGQRQPLRLPLERFHVTLGTRLYQTPDCAVYLAKNGQVYGHGLNRYGRLFPGLPPVRIRRPVALLGWRL